MQVELKTRKLKNGNQGLYLEFYETGFRKKMTLNLFLIPDDAPNAKMLNEHTLKLAQEIRADKILNPPSFNEPTPSELNERANTITWLEWCDEYIQYSKGCGNCVKMIGHKGVVRKRIAHFLTLRNKKDILLKDVDKDVLVDLFTYMRKYYRNTQQIKTNGGKLADYTLLLFEETVKAIFNKAIREGLLLFNPVKCLDRSERFHAPDKHREFLSPDELQRFLTVQTATPQEDNVQRAFGFSCMTGLRLGDMRTLRWSDIRDIDGVKVVSIIQHKTKREVSVPLNEMAMSMLPEPLENGEDGVIFSLSKKPDWVAMYVRRIKNKAGIEKDLTFHCSRHTAATMAISAGAELYTVSKILGHGSIESTQVYAKVDLSKKTEAVNLTDGIFS